MLAWPYWKFILRLSEHLRSQPSQVSVKRRSPGSLRDAYNLGVHQGKTKVGEASSAVAMDEYIRLQFDI